MDVPTLVASTLIAAPVGALAGYIAQRRLAERQAVIDYELAAKKRLYEAIGPLRFQLLIAARDVVRRVDRHDEGAWDMRTDRYYANSFVYRLLRPLALAILIERQMTYADFSVDKAGMALLRFETTVYRMLAGADPVPYYTNFDWSSERDHVFRDNLRRAAGRLIEKDGGALRVIDYGRFAERYGEPELDPVLAPLAAHLGRCGANLRETPVFWVRIVGYAYACSRLLATEGDAIGFGPRPLDTGALLRATTDPEIKAHLADYPRIFDDVLNESV